MKLEPMSPQMQRAHGRKVTPGVDLARAVTPDREALIAKMLPVEPPRISMDEFRQMLMSAVLTGASDVTFQSDQSPRAEIHGILYCATQRPLAATEVNQILIESYGGANGPTEIAGRNILDYSYELNLPDGSRQRFRVNATGIYGFDGSGVELTFRALPSRTPDQAMVRLSDHEIEALTPRNGLVVIAGGTGSGKSTTMAAVTRHHLENISEPRKIVDIQAPIEYTFRDIMVSMKRSSSMIGQSEVGRHIRSFADGVRSALRRKPAIINVGEARDFETISASLEASLTGHLVYTTTHAGNCAETIRRLLTTFPGNERESRAYDLLAALRFLMVQHLLPTVDGRGRVPVREYVKITDRLREEMIVAPINDWAKIVTDVVAGRTMLDDPQRQVCSLTDVCRTYYRDGIINRADAVHLGGPEAVGD